MVVEIKLTKSECSKICEALQRACEDLQDKLDHSHFDDYTADEEREIRRKIRQYTKLEVKLGTASSLTQEGA